MYILESAAFLTGDRFGQGLPHAHPLQDQSGITPHPTDHHTLNRLDRAGQIQQKKLLRRRERRYFDYQQTSGPALAAHCTAQLVVFLHEIRGRRGVVIRLVRPLLHLF